MGGVNSGMGVLARCMLAQLSHEHQRTALRLSGDAGGEGVSCGAGSAHSVVVILCWVGVCVYVVGQHCPRVVFAKIVPVCPHVGEYSIVEKDSPHPVKIEIH